MITHVNQRISPNYNEMEDALNQVEEYEDAKILKQSIQQYQHIVETLKKHSTMTIQDDAHFWE